MPSGDPGVDKAVQVAGDGAGPGAEFDVVIKGLACPRTLRYRTEKYDPPQTLVVRANNQLVTSIDTITVVPDGTGSIVTYDAELTMNGLLGLADPLLRASFKMIGDRAARGLVCALDGERTKALSS